MIYMNAQIEGTEVASKYISIRFLESGGTELCRLVSPPFNYFNFNLRDESGEFLEFISNVNSEIDCIWDLFSHRDDIDFHMDYLVSGGIAMIRGDDDSNDPLDMLDIRRRMWYELIRMGFRPSLGDFS
jgi:hypothetical protein